ncbi:MAG: T9SS type A sorting domain-containing protein, partial [Bacteroidales bacterium]|nr:T9SS type A sorting domain-containing protein [Bacteroidales bacterium]
PIGGMPPYSYQWSNGQTTQTAVGLIANTTYRVTVKDGCSNTVVKTTVLSQPQALSASVVTYASSPCQPTGTAVATASNGTPPYTYKWNTGATTSIIQNIPAGTYTVTVKDACNAQVSVSRSVSAKNISIARTITCTPAGQCKGSITVNVTGGDPPYTYLWSNGQTTQTATNLCKGNYRVTVTDALGCTKVSNLYSVPNCKSFVVENDFDPEYTKGESNKSLEIQIYPNPVSSELTIMFSSEVMDEDYKIEVYDILGNKLIEKFNKTAGEFKLNVSNIADGVYVLHICSSSVNVQHKFIIQKE